MIDANRFHAKRSRDRRAKKKEEKKQAAACLLVAGLGGVGWGTV